MSRMQARIKYIWANIYSWKKKYSQTVIPELSYKGIN